MYWVATSVFGDREEARRAGLWVKGRHAHVKGTDPVTGNDYSPSRPDLAAYAHGSIWESQLLAYEVFVRRLSDEERERYWQEGLIVAELLGVDVDLVPPTYAAWVEYYEDVVGPGVALSSSAYRMLEATRAASFAPAWARPLARTGVWVLEELTLATLGPIERGVFGKPRSEPRVALTRLAGRYLFAFAAVPPVRDALEQAGFGERAHELLAEAREITRRGAGDRRSGPGSDRGSRTAVAA